MRIKHVYRGAVLPKETVKINQNVTHIHYISGTSGDQTYAHHCYTVDDSYLCIHSYVNGEYNVTSAGVCPSCGQSGWYGLYSYKPKGGGCNMTADICRYCDYCHFFQDLTGSGLTSFPYNISHTVTRYKCPWTQGTSVMGSVKLVETKKGGRYTLKVTQDGTELNTITSYLWNDGTTESEILLLENGLYSCKVNVRETKSNQNHVYTLSYVVNDIPTGA